MSANDLIICVFVVGDDDNVDTNISAPTLTGTSFTEVADLSVIADDDNVDVSVWYGYYAGTDTTLAWAAVGGTDASNTSECMIFRGVKLAADGGPFDVTSTSTTGQDGGTPDPISINTTGSAGIWTVIAAGTSHVAGGAATYTSPTGYTTNFGEDGHDDTNDAQSGMGYNSSPSDPEDPGAMTFSGSAATNSWGAVTMALSPAAAPTCTAGLNLPLLGVGGCP